MNPEENEEEAIDNLVDKAIEQDGSRDIANIAVDFPTTTPPKISSEIPIRLSGGSHPLS